MLLLILLLLALSNALRHPVSVRLSCGVSDANSARLFEGGDVTITEMSVYAEAVRQQSGTLLKDLDLAPAVEPAKAEPPNTSPAAIARELRALQPEVCLNLFRRNIALRNNKVLNPARNAQVIANLINVFLYEGMYESLVDVTSYVGLTPDTYYSAGSRELCVGDIAYYCAKRMLELPLEREAWLRGGRQGPEPDTPEERGEEGQDFRYTSVVRADLALRVTDMVFAVARLALRRAAQEAAGAGPQRYTLSFARVAPCLAAAGYPVCGQPFRERLAAMLRQDLLALDPASSIETSG